MRVLIGFAEIAFVLALRWQAHIARPVFEVVSVKPAVSTSPGAPARLIG
jgi:hypothetical protein